MEGCKSLEVRRIDGNSSLEEDLHHGRMTLPARPVNGPWTLRTQTGQIDRSRAFDEVSHQLDIAVESYPVGWRVAMTIPGRQTLHAELVHEILHLADLSVLDNIEDVVQTHGGGTIEPLKEEHIFVVLDAATAVSTVRAATR